MRLLAGPLLIALAAAAFSAGAEAPIDRRALVRRHYPVPRGFDTEAPLSVGNGELAFDATRACERRPRAVYQRSRP